jgi:hypothetical protein
MKKIFVWGFITAGLLLSAAFARAQDSTSQTNSNVRTVTGCLQQGDNAKEFSLLGQDGGTWEIRSDSVDLAGHVGQTVTITGAVSNAAMHGMKEDMKKEAQEHGMDKGATEHGHLTATQLNVMSNHCTQ